MPSSSGGTAAAGAQGGGMRGSASSAATARSSASASGAASAPVFVSTTAPVRSPRWTHETGEEARHRAAVAGEDPIAATVELEAEPPPHVPRAPRPPSSARAPSGRGSPSAARRRLRRRGTSPSARGRPPSTTTTRPRPSTPSPRDRARHAPCRCTGRRSSGLAFGASGRRLVRARPSGSRMRRWRRSAYDLAADTHHDLAEQREDEIRVVPLLARPKDELGVLEAGDQLLARRRLHRLPDLARRLALDAGEMARAPCGSSARPAPRAGRCGAAPRARSGPRRRAA